MFDFLLETYLWAVSGVCLFFLALSLANCVAFRRLTHPPRTIGSPRVSILVPARDEETNIGPCLDSLLDQDYGNYEILVLDDDSSDRTGEIIRDYAAKHPRLRALSGKPLPDGWLGKHYACHQLSKEADGDYLLFTDADTVHARTSVSWAMTNMLDHDADFMSAYTRQKIGSFGEALVVPGMYLVTALLLPIWLIPRSRRASISFAIGQFIITRKSAFWSVGGYEKFKDSIVDDLAMVRQMKSIGCKTLFLDGKDFIGCRMYHSYREAFGGIVKNLFAALDKKLYALIGLFLLIVLAIELPLVNLAYRLSTGGDHLLLSALPVGLFLVTWLLSLLDRKLSPLVPLLYPLLFLNLMAISVVSAAKTGYGSGALWKGRRVK